MKINRSGLQRFNICMIFYFVFLCFFYEKTLFGGVFFEVSKVLIWIFLLLLAYESFSSGYTESRIFIMLTLLLLFFIFVINQCIPLSTHWGFGFYELKYALFTLPLQSLPWLNEYTFILFSLNFYLIGYLIKKFKGAAKA